MSEVILNNESEQVDTGKDNVAIRRVISTVPGGKSLDVSEFTPEVINAGHPIIQDGVSKNYKPMPVVISGGILTKGAHAPGSGYTNNGTYTNVSLIGGSGSGAKATIVVLANAVTGVTITTPGTGYKAGDILSATAANIGTGGTGFQFAVLNVDGKVTSYGALPAGHTFRGALIASILTKKAYAAILRIGAINPEACPYDFATIAEAFKTAVPLIDQIAD